jgi:hypothetical protein
MKRHALVLVAIEFGLLGALSVASVPTYAGGTAQQATGSVPLKKLAEEFREKTGTELLVDPSIANQAIVRPTIELDGDTVGNWLDAVTKKLPKGSAWAVMMLPERKGGYPYSEVASLLVLQNKMFGAVGSYNASDFELFGKRVKDSETASLIDGLSLRRHFLIAKSLQQSAVRMDPSRPGFKEDMGSAMESVMAMDPASRSEVLKTAFSALKGAMGRLAPEERTGFIASMVKEMGGTWAGLLFQQTPTPRRR